MKNGEEPAYEEWKYDESEPTLKRSAWYTRQEAFEHLYYLHEVEQYFMTRL